MNISDNKYYKGATDATLKGISEGFGYGFSAGSTAFAWAGPWSLLAGSITGILGMAIGGVSAKADYINDVANQRDIYTTNMKQATKERNRGILRAKNLVDSTRSSFDTKYGEGMFDQYDDLFQQVFKIGAGNTLSDFFNNMSFDKVAGEITSSMKDYDLTNVAKDLTLSDLNEAYYEYFTDQIRSANTAYGMESRYNATLLKNTLKNYSKDVDMLQSQAANQFQTTFLNYVSENVQGEMALGSASAKEGASGIRQTGKLTSMQEFQNDMAQVAYASNLNYLVTQYTSMMESTKTSLIEQIDKIKTSQAISDRQMIEQSLDIYNKHNDALLDSAFDTKDKEGFITETKKEVDEIDEFLENGGTKSTQDMSLSVDEKKEKVTMEDLF